MFMESKLHYSATAINISYYSSKLDVFFNCYIVKRVIMVIWQIFFDI